MIGFFLMMIVVITLASAVGYTMISSVQTAGSLSTAGRNIARVEQVIDALRQVVIVDSEGNFFMPMGENVTPPGEVSQRTLLPSWVSSIAMAPWGTPYGYCAYAPNAWTGSVSGTASIEGGGASYSVDLFNEAVIFGANRDYVASSARASNAADVGTVPQVLAFILSPINNSNQVPSCADVFWNGQSWTVPGGAVRAITRDAMADSLALSPRILRRYVSASGSGSGAGTSERASLDRVLAEWRYLRPSRMTVDMQAGVYEVDIDALDLGSGPGSSLPSGATMSRALHFIGNSVIITDSGGGGTLSIPGDTAFSGSFTFSSDAALRIGPFGRLLLQDVAIQSEIFVDGGNLSLEGTAITQLGGTVPVTVAGGQVVALGTNSITTTESVPAMLFRGGDLHISGALSFNTGSGPFIDPASYGRISHVAGSTVLRNDTPILNDLPKIFPASEGGSSASSMVEGWPDAIVCNVSNPNWGNVTAFAHHMPLVTTGKFYYRTNQEFRSELQKSDGVIFNPDGTFDSLDSSGDWVATSCDGKSIAQLYADGQAFNFVGGQGTGSADNLGNHTATQTINANTNRIVNLANPVDPQDAATKGYVDAVASSGGGGSADNLGDHTATQNIDANTNRIVNLADPVNPQDAATRGYVDAAASSAAGDNLGDHTATQNIDADTNRIVNLANPVNPQDAATKNYVDALALTSDTLAGLNCTDGQVPAWNNGTSAWECSDVLTSASYMLVRMSADQTLVSSMTVSFDTVAQSKGDSITHSGNQVTLKGGKSYFMITDIRPIGTSPMVADYYVHDVTNNVAIGTLGMGNASDSSPSIAQIFLSPTVDTVYEVRTAGTGGSLSATTNGSEWSIMEIGSGAGTGASGGDDLGNHTATQNLDLSTHKLVGNGGTEGIAVAASGNVGIGTAAPLTMLSVGPNPQASFNSNELFQLGKTGDAYMSIRDGAGALISGVTGGVSFTGTQNATPFTIRTNNAQRVMVTSDGNVGIGTGAPSAKLHVNGDAHVLNLLTMETNADGVRIQDNDSSARLWLRYAPNNSTYLDSMNAIFFRTNFQAGHLNTMSLMANGAVGIGTTAPTARLHVDSPSGNNLSLTSDSQGTMLSLVSGTGGGDASQGAQIFMRNMSAPSNNNSKSLRINVLGDFEMLNHAYSATLFRVSNNGTMVVSGDALKPGGGMWTAISDARLKSVNGEYKNGLAEILALEPVRFHYKDGNVLEQPTDREFIGLIAQEAMEIMPEIVNKREDGFYTLDSSAIPYALINAAKELKLLFDTLAAKIAELFEGIKSLHEADNFLKSEIDALKAENEKLRAANDDFRRELDEIRAAIGK